MFLLNNLSLRMKIMAGFMVVMSFTVVLGVFAFAEVNSLGNIVNDFATDRGEIQSSYHQSDTAAVDKYLQRLNDQKEAIAKDVAGYDQTNQTGEERKNWGEAQQVIGRYLTSVARTFQLIKEGKGEEATVQQYQVSKKEFDDFMNLVGGLVDFNNKQALEGA